MQRLAALCALAGCDAVFGLNAVPDPTGDAAGSGSAAPYTYEQFYAAHGEYGQQMTVVPFTIAPKAGSLIVVAIGTYWNDPTLVTDTTGNVYTEVGTNPRSDGGSEVSIYYTVNKQAASTFALTVATVESMTHVGADEVTVIAHEFSGAFRPAPLDLEQSATGNPNSSSQIDSDCGMVATNAPEVMVAALTRDFNGTVTATPTWHLVKSIDLDHTMYAVLATEYRIAGPETARPILSSEHQADGTSWACLWATFR